MRIWMLLVVTALVVTACSQGGASPGNDPGPSAGEPAPTDEPGTAVDVSQKSIRSACSLPKKEMIRVWTGYNPERSGDIQYIPREPNYVGNWQSHSGPWAYLQQIPMFFYGPGHVPEVGRVSRPVTMADLAPTLAQFLGFEFNAPDGEPLTEAVIPDADPPKLILTMVWDGGGIDVLDTYPTSWSGVERLIPKGVWFENATVGSSPSVTPAIHTTLGTGAIPRRHGIMDLIFRVEDKLTSTRARVQDYLLVPTLADLYDLDRANNAVVGTVSPGGTQGMIGQGAGLDGGDRDVAIFSQQGHWESGGDAYEYPGYAVDEAALEEARRRLDLADGKADGLWLGQELPDASGNLGDTPAFAEYQTGMLEDIIDSEGFGADNIPDLLFTNYKQIDQVGHGWGFPTPQMEAVVQSSDRAFMDLTEILDRQVGEGEWVMVLTADHGATPLPETTGAYPISNFELADDIDARFDGDGDDVRVVRDVRPTQGWLNLHELEQNGHTVDEVARFLMNYTVEQNTPEGRAFAADPDQVVFSAAFPGPALEQLPCLPETLTG
jgi:predicted AlkP superfamily pyrophosphatase or phosphodiesterase